MNAFALIARPPAAGADACEHFFDPSEPSADRACLECGILWRAAEADCRHPPEARISYRDRAAPLGRDGETFCDLCGARVED